MEFKDQLQLAYDSIAQKLLQAFRDEARLQGHYNRGKLDRSMEYKMYYFAMRATVTFFMEEYGIALNSGIPANRIPFTSGSGKTDSQYIKGLIDFFISKGFGEEAVSMAFRTAFVHKKEGMPTKASSRFSKNGKRVGFVEDAYGRNEKMIVEKLESIIDMDLLVNDLVRDLQREIKIYG